MTAIDERPAEVREPDHATFDSLDPATGDVVDSYPVHTAADVEAAVAAAREASTWWSALTFAERADVLGKCWGLGSDTTKDPGPWEGEQRNMWKPTQVQNLWMHGGNLHQSRHYSLYLGLQLKARLEGVDTPVYALQEVHHTG